MHALNFLGVGERVTREAGPTERYLMRHFRTGAVINTRWTGPDYFERFGIAEGLRRLAEDFPFQPRTLGRAVPSTPKGATA